jgi:hypothetical protein
MLGLLAIVLASVSCATQPSVTTTDNVETTTSALEEVPADVTTNDAEIPLLEPIVQGGEALLGLWQSACLIPDEKSDYAEQHYFEFYGNRLATHRREIFYKKSCLGSDDTIINNYSYTIPTDGQINLTDLDTGLVLYDIYAANSTTLKFGHGFRNTLPYPTATGSSESNRVTDLNTYIVYAKVVLSTYD